jgi:ribosomal protein S12 methylthiotransferase
MRGKHASVSQETLITQAKNLVAKGTKEIILIAQDLTYYGLDTESKRTLPDLLRRLSDVEGLDWIRLQYAYPSGFPTEILDVMAERSNICNYLDMPLQHGSNNILKLMRRGITREKTQDLLATIRSKVSDVAIRTTLIVGHPGETEADFEEMVQFVQESQFDRLGVFTYSHEEQTHAFSMDDNVPEDVKQERADEIMAIQQDISLNLNQAKIGKTFKTLIDRVEGGYYVGRTEHDSPEVDNEVLIKQTPELHLRLGDFTNVHISHVEEFDLYGTIVAQN